MSTTHGPLAFLYRGLPHGEWVLEKHYPKDPEDGDGQPVDVEVMAMPARFYRITAKTSPNGVGRMREGFALSTGSGSEMECWAHDTAREIAQGMIGLDAPRLYAENVRLREAMRSVLAVAETHGPLTTDTVPGILAIARAALTEPTP